MVCKKTVASFVLMLCLVLSLIFINPINVLADTIHEITWSHYLYGPPIGPGCDIESGEAASFTVNGQTTVRSLPFYFEPSKTYKLVFVYSYTLVKPDLWKSCTFTKETSKMYLGSQSYDILPGWNSITVSGVHGSLYSIEMSVDVNVPAGNPAATTGFNVGHEYQILVQEFEEIETIEDKINDNILEGNELQQEQNQLQQEENETSKNIFDKITDFFDNFFTRLGDFLMGLIVPSSDELTEFLDCVNDWFGERLGFIWYPFSLAVDMVSALAGGAVDTGFTVPAFKLSFQGTEYTIWGDFSVDLDAFGIFKYVRIFTSFIVCGATVSLAVKKWDDWIGGRRAQ